MVTVSLRFEEKIKKELERRISFEIEASRDPFYSKTNMDQIEKSLNQIKSGQVVVRTMEELETYENE